MITRRASLLLRTVSVNSRCSVLSSVSSSSPVIPITAFIGVRISWLIVARNLPLLAAAATAAPWAAVRADAARRRSVTSREIPQVAYSLPCPSNSGNLTDSYTWRPSGASDHSSSS